MYKMSQLDDIQSLPIKMNHVIFKKDANRDKRRVGK